MQVTTDRREGRIMWQTIMQYRCGICISVLAVLEAAALLIPNAMASGLAYLMLIAFLLTMLAINLDSLHAFLKRKHKGGYSL